jgi:hypothetical protein
VGNATKAAADKDRGAHAQRLQYIADALSNRATAPLRLADGSLPDTVLQYGQPVRPRAESLLDAALRTHAQRVTAKALVDITEDDAARLLDINGEPLSSVSQGDIEQLLFGADHTRGAAPRHRRDILEVACRLGTPPQDRCPHTEDGGPRPDVGGGAGLAPGEATHTMLKESLAQLLAATENLAVPPGVASPRPRATPQRIGEDLHALTLRSGPADSVAQFDFDRLLLASDLPVRHHPDRIVVTELEWAARTIGELGGDLDARLRSGADIVEAIRSESALLAAADPWAADRATPPNQIFAFGPLGIVEDMVGEALDFAQDLVGGVGGSGRRRGTRDHRRPKSPSSPPPRGRDRFADLRKLLVELQRMRSADYGFTAFATDDDGRAATFGLLLGYRQRWEPRGYQAGELVKTVPLGPKSTVKYTARRKTGRSYNDKRAQASESAYSNESQDVQRDVAKIVRNAKVTTSFTLTNQAGGEIPGIGSASSTSVWQTGAERTSESTKESFREATRKHAEQLKQSSSTEVVLTTTEEEEVQESSEVTNPNDELVVTYLFYELQRKFLVSEHLQKATPVVLIAQELPAPSDINEEWVIRNDWVLRRVLLDPTFLPAVDCMSSGKLAADYGVVEELEAHLNQQADLVKKLQLQLEALRTAQLLPDPRNLAEMFKARIYDQKYGASAWRQDEQRVREVFGEDVAERLAMRRRSEEQIQSELQRETGQLDKATDAFNTAFASYATEAVQAERALLHFKENILYYQQALWDHEGRDQRYLRLRDTLVPRVQGTVEYELWKSDRPPRPPTWLPPLEVEITANLSVNGERPLHEIADLATPLGYLGNAIVYPLVAWDPLVTFLLAPSANALTGVSDPDDRANLTLADFDRLVCCLKEHLQEAEFNALVPHIEEAYKARIADPRPDAEEIVLPTGSLFIEALPGAHPVLEDFKLLHRALDVQQVATDLVTKRLEQLRLAARLVAEELEDPDIDKKIVVEGSDSVIVPPDGT